MIERNKIDELTKALCTWAKSQGCTNLNAADARQTVHSDIACFPELKHHIEHANINTLANWYIDYYTNLIK